MIDGVDMQETKPLWRQREADCKKIGSTFIEFVTADEASILKQYLELEDLQIQLDILDQDWNTYELELEHVVSEGMRDHQEYELKRLEYRKDRTALEFKQKQSLQFQQKNNPTLFVDAREILVRVNGVIQSYIDSIKVEDFPKKTVDPTDGWAND